MASVDGHRDRGHDDHGHGDRAQMVLIGALAVAVSLVMLAVVLNSAIYTQNLATRSGEAGTGAAVDARDGVRDGVGAITDRVNENHAGDDYATLTGTHLPAAMDDWRPAAVRHVMASGRTFRVDLAGNTEGTRIADGSVGTFEPRTSGANPLGYGSPNWLVATPVEVRHFRLSDVSASDLTSASASFDPQTTSDVFFVEVRETGGSDAWQVALYEDGGKVSVEVWDEDEGSAVGSCLADSTATVDLTRATLDGQRCEPLAFLDDVDGLAKIYYVNSDDVSGTYELTVDRAGYQTGDPLKDRVDAANYDDQCSGPTYFDSPSEAGGGSPYATAAIYSTTVDFRYLSQSVTYDTRFRVANDEPGPIAKHPKVIDVTVTDNSDSGASFTVSWSVTDPNGDLDTISVELRRDDSVVDSSTTAVDGGSDSGSTTLSDSDGDGNTYTIVVEVTDSESNTRSNSETHVADDDASGCPP